MSSDIPAQAMRESAKLHQEAEALAAKPLPEIGAELRRMERELTASTTVEKPLRVLMLAVAKLAEAAR